MMTHYKPQLTTTKRSDQVDVYPNLLPYGFTSIGQKHVQVVAGPGQLAIRDYGYFLPQIYQGTNRDCSEINRGFYTHNRRRAFEIWNLTGIPLLEEPWHWTKNDGVAWMRFHDTAEGDAKHPMLYSCPHGKRPVKRMHVGTIDMDDPWCGPDCALVNEDIRQANAEACRNEMIRIIKAYEIGETTTLGDQND